MDNPAIPSRACQTLLFGCGVPIHFDNNSLVDALQAFVRKTDAKLPTAGTILGETESSPKQNMPSLFSNILSDGIIDVVDDIIPAVPHGRRS